ncbi:mitochondrial distribution and morphology protein 10 [Nadsonia fulvescens var. elongata DSM 6958]|uniref:Mitochondrial distribution and morphology protein 10 n=1 Tax=Nadsonia fulvescens var. elongata DSM 6958 TaxID=857566 RepID=A0A1E3PGS5_9ASCO|nr:mitochondrial distribution and morphology protein 10 [Nadsonia fulvescens var. elongata DSM 6958]
MRTYMDYVLRCFYESTGWNEDNIYPNITLTSQSLLDFKVPNGFGLNLSSQSSPNSASTYNLTNLGFVSGSVAYLYSSKPLCNIQSTKSMDLKDVVTGYKLLTPLRETESRLYWNQWHGAARNQKRDTLYYGRMYLPGRGLEAMLVRRLSPTTQLLITCVSDSHLKNGGTLTMHYQRDVGQWCNELIYSTNEALLGVRGMFNFGYHRKLREYYNASRLSIGGELYYGVLNKSPGLSIAARYVANSAYTGTPLTLTLTCNPLVGHLSTAYSLMASNSTQLSSRFDFNVYSYMSDLSIGCEIWKNKYTVGSQSGPSDTAPEIVDIKSPEFAVKRESRLSSRQSSSFTMSNGTCVPEEEFTNVLKASTSFGSRNVKLLWEGRYKELLLSSGVMVNLVDGTPVISTIGVEVQYSC